MEFVKMKEIHRKETVDLVTDIFLNHAPILSHTKPPVAVTKRFVEVCVDRAMRDGISVVAIDTEVNKVIGAMLNHLLCSTSEVDGDYEKAGVMGPALEPFTLMLHVLKMRCSELDHTKTLQAAGEKFMEVIGIVVSDGYHGRGVTRRLLQESIEMGKSKGAKMVYSVLTSPISQHIFATTPGFVRVGDMSQYDEFEVNGQKPFLGMPAGRKGATLDMKKL